MTSPQQARMSRTKLRSVTHRWRRPHPPYPQPAATTEKRPGEVQAYTVEQVAEMLHIGRDKVYYLLRTGQLRSIKIGKLRRITDRHLAEFVASLESPVK
jgi:excisionase family DNA binding protein